MRAGLFAITAAVILCRPDSGSAQTVEPGQHADVVVQGVSVQPTPPLVETLGEALARTYRTNPTLMAQRAATRGLDSGAALERAEGRPFIGTSARFNRELYTTRSTGRLGRDLTASADVEQVIFAGGRIRNSVKAADVRVIAGRADLRATEGDVLTEAVSAYADLVRDRASRSFNLNLVKVLEDNLASTQSRLRVGDLTRTDVSQSEARLSVAQSNLAVSEGRVQSSEENFERVVGSRAGTLQPLPPLPPMPQTAEQAVAIAVANNADVAAFTARARAADYEVAAVKAERLPTVSAVASTAYSNSLGTANTANGLPSGTLLNSFTNIGAGLTLRLPLYQGGAASARVRIAEEARAVFVEQAISAERLAVANARAAFATWRSSLTSIAANRSAVASNEVALRSVRVEQSVGSRSIIEVLNAEQELLSSQIALASAERDAYVAAFTLLNAMGAAEAIDLGVGSDGLYDPQSNYRRYGRTLSDWADGPRHPPASTRTVPEAVNGPLTRLNVDTPTPEEVRP